MQEEHTQVDADINGYIKSLEEMLHNKPVKNEETKTEHEHDEENKDPNVGADQPDQEGENNKPAANKDDPFNVLDSNKNKPEDDPQPNVNKKGKKKGCTIF